MNDPPGLTPLPPLTPNIQSKPKSHTHTHTQKDYTDFDDDLPEALVTYIVEVDPKGALGAGARADRVYRPLAGLSLRMSGHWRAGYADLVLSQVRWLACGRRRMMRV